MQTRTLLAAVAALFALVIAGCGSGDSTSATDSTGDSSAKATTPKELTNAYGKLVGICLASEFTEGPEFKERDEMRTHLQVITEAAETSPNTEAEGMTPEEILFDAIPVLKGCDEALALEAEAAVGR